MGNLRLSMALRTLALVAVCLAVQMACSAAEPGPQDVVSLHSNTGQMLGESNESPTLSALKKKLAGLDKTYDRIKSSCAAGAKGPSASKLKAVQEMQAKAAKSESVEQLQEAIKAKNALIDKIADECMPGEMLGESNESPTLSALKKELAGLDKTYDRIKSSCAAGAKGPSASKLKAVQE